MVAPQGLLDMAPSTSLDHGDRSLDSAMELFCESLVADAIFPMSLANRVNNVGGQSGVDMTFATGEFLGMQSRPMRIASYGMNGASMMHSAFHNCVSHVVERSSEEEMRGVYTGSVVAAMKDVQPIRLAEVECARNLMSTGADSLDSHGSVAVSFCCQPCPTRIFASAFVNLGPETEGIW